MPEALKNAYSEDKLREFAQTIQSAYADFPAENFITAVMDDSWDSLELKGRWNHITTVLGTCLPQDYIQALNILKQIAPDCSDYFRIVLPNFVDIYGQDETYWDETMDALEVFTIGSSSELAVRSFIMADEERMMKQMRKWAQHENDEVRRLASEGCRPALPWSPALTSFKKDPSPVLPILEQLRNDPSAYVRKSVANNLNDISKTHPELVIQIAQNWQGESDHADWIIKHACRTLLKRGDRDALALFGFHDGESIDVLHFELESTKDIPTISIGDDLIFSFSVHTDKATKLRLEYSIDFVKKNGKTSRKVFQISETELAAGETKTHTKKHSFKDLSTRKHYPGTHAISLITNGVERETLSFEVT